MELLKPQPRDLFVERLRRNLIGTGGDIFGVADNEELLLQPPFQTYYSAILFPDKGIEITKGKSDDLAATVALDNTDAAIRDDFDPTVENVEGENVEGENKDINDDENNAARTSTESRGSEEYVAANNYFPTHFGMTFCVADGCKSVKLSFKAGHYIELTSPEHVALRKIKINPDDFYALYLESDFPFTDLLDYDDTEGFVFLKRDIPSAMRGVDVSNKLKQFRVNHTETVRLLEMLMAKKPWKRKNLAYNWTLDLENPPTEPVTIFQWGDHYVARCYTKIIGNYVKILLKNEAKHASTKFSNGNEELNEKCLFQVHIEASEASFSPYKDRSSISPFDAEVNFLNYQYQEIRDFGIGHGCAVEWTLDTEGVSASSVRTTFLPCMGIPSVSQDFREGQTHLKEVAILRNLSVWSTWTHGQTCDKLAQFVEAYADWIVEQTAEANAETSEYQQIAKEITEKQQIAIKRLRHNLTLLRNSKQVFDCFQLTNTAMLLQMVISRDKEGRFGNVEKHLEDFEAIKNPVKYNSLAFFEQYTEGSLEAYRPFQLAFLLLNLESIVDPTCADRQNLVDLIWFPTGGGKTEAYLALTAFTILWRRMNERDGDKGVAVIMRYTLRLLTSQQFERAARLICSLEFMRKQKDQLPPSVKAYRLGHLPITIGMWVGGETTPNNLERAKLCIEKIDAGIAEANNKQGKDAPEAERANRFQVTACPFCGCRLITRNKKGWLHGFKIQEKQKRFRAICQNSACLFSNNTEGVPFDVVDESLYQEAPTLLFATVDKFARLAHREEGHIFFNSLSKEDLPPDLIIQDELHLLNGPLGSIVGLYEMIVEMLCTKGNRRPKMIASTATTRNTDEQISQLYGGRQAIVFPAAGLRYDDNYFSRIIKGDTKRLHVGFMSTGKTAVDAQVRAMIPTLLFARLEVYNAFQKGHFSEADWHNYWTIVSYYNTLRDVGRTYNKVGDEIISELKKQQRRYGFRNADLDFNHSGLLSRTKELTSRISSDKIKTALKDLEAKPILNTFKGTDGLDRKGLDSGVVDLVLASNMFSVGIDISRLNIMLMNGQSKNVAEYIQASSRVARRDEGLVVNLLDANRAREKSYFEHYLPFHQAYYRFVEPLTVTPYTEITFQKALNSLLVTYVRHVRGFNENEAAHDFDGNIDTLLRGIQNRISDTYHEMRGEAEEVLTHLVEDWLKKIEDKKKIQKKLSYKNLITKSTTEPSWALMSSMREIDTETAFEILLDSYTKSNK